VLARVWSASKSTTHGRSSGRPHGSGTTPMPMRLASTSAATSQLTTSPTTLPRLFGRSSATVPRAPLPCSFAHLCCVGQRFSRARKAKLSVLLEIIWPSSQAVSPPRLHKHGCKWKNSVVLQSIGLGPMGAIVYRPSGPLFTNPFLLTLAVRCLRQICQAVHARINDLPLILHRMFRVRL